MLRKRRDRATPGGGSGPLAKAAVRRLQPQIGGHGHGV
jgi:hypothetical protein